MFRLVFFVFVVTLASEIEYRIVRTRFGSIRGKRLDSYGGQSGFVFAGIPFARPPVGKLRFKAPVDPERWPGILDTLAHRNACLSDPKKTYLKEGGGPVSEDCLYLNLFTSQHCLEKGNCSVMAFLHGGGLKYQSPASFRMDTIINNFANEERNIIVIFLVYRMGAMGAFHPIEDRTTIIDNIHFGLQWIQREVRTFGGNPGRVTLMGHSAGAMATKFAILSPSFEGLFFQAVIMSSPNPADLSKIANQKFSWKIARNLNCTEEDTHFPRNVQEVVSCMREKSAENILAAQLDIFDDEVEVTYGPWIDGEILPDYMKNLMKNLRKVNLMIGSVAYEFVNMRHSFNKEGKLLLERLYEACWHLAYLMNYEKAEKFIAACFNFYKNENRTIHLEDDRSIHFGVGELATGISRTGGKVFVYSYTYAGAKNVYDKYTDRGGYHPDHTEEYIYVFGLHRSDQFMEPKDYEIERIFTGIINFDENIRMPGMKENFRGEIMDFYEQTVPRLVGDYSPLSIFPEKADIVMFMDVFNGITAFWTNRTFDKSIEAMTESYWMWRNHVELLKKSR